MGTRNASMTPPAEGVVDMGAYGTGKTPVVERWSTWLRGRRSLCAIGLAARDILAWLGWIER